MDSLSPPPYLNIAVIEDYPVLCEQLVRHLRQDGHQVSGVPDGLALDTLMQTQALDLLVLDLNLPHEDGNRIAARIRQSHPAMLILMLTVRNMSADRVAGYQSGADLYLAKPVEPDELSAAVFSLSRRLPATRAQAWQLHEARRQLHAPGGHVLRLTPIETRVLRLFAEAREQTLTHADLWIGLSPLHRAITQSHIEVLFSRFRRKLAPLPGGDPNILAVRGRGYQCCIPLKLID